MQNIELEKKSEDFIENKKIGSEHTEIAEEKTDEAIESTEPIECEPVTDIIEDNDNIANALVRSDEESLPLETQTSGTTLSEDIMSSLETLTNKVNELDVLKANQNLITGNITNINDSTSKIAKEIRDLHRLYHGEFTTQIQSMEDELERFRKIEKGRVFDEILADLANLYSKNEDIQTLTQVELVQKRLQVMFSQILQILENYDVYMLKSQPGDKRNNRHCIVLEKIPTENKEQHDTILKSRNTGFFKESRTIVKEMVDVFIYKENKEVSKEAPVENKENNSISEDI